MARKQEDSRLRCDGELNSQEARRFVVQQAMKEERRLTPERRHLKWKVETVAKMKRSIDANLEILRRSGCTLEEAENALAGIADPAFSSFDKEFGEHFDLKEGAPAVVETFGAYKDSAVVAAAAVQILKRELGNKDLSRERCRLRRLSELSVEAMTSHPASADVQIAGCNALRSGSVATKEAFVAVSDAVKTFHRNGSTDVSTTRVLYEALTALGMWPRFKRELGFYRDTLPKPLLKAMTKYRGKDIYYSICIKENARKLCREVYGPGWVSRRNWI